MNRVFKSQAASYLFTSKPYALTESELEAKACLNTLFFVGCIVLSPVWVPIAGIEYIGMKTCDLISANRKKKLVNRLKSDMDIDDIQMSSFVSFIIRKDNLVYLIVNEYTPDGSIAYEIQNNYKSRNSYIVIKVDESTYSDYQVFLNLLNNVMKVYRFDKREVLVLNLNKSGIPTTNLGNTTIELKDESYYGVLGKTFRIRYLSEVHPIT